MKQRKYEIWAEGYRVTGQSSGANFLGTCEGRTFKEACIKFMDTPYHRQYFNEGSMTYWGCKLYDNGHDARNSFG